MDERAEQISYWTAYYGEANAQHITDVVMRREKSLREENERLKEVIKGQSDAVNILKHGDVGELKQEIVRLRSEHRRVLEEVEDKCIKDAPAEFNLREAYAWTRGYNSALAKIQELKALSAEGREK